MPGSCCSARRAVNAQRSCIRVHPAQLPALPALHEKFGQAPRESKQVLSLVRGMHRSNNWTRRSLELPRTPVFRRVRIESPCASHFGNLVNTTMGFLIDPSSLRSHRNPFSIYRNPTHPSPSRRHCTQLPPLLCPPPTECPSKPGSLDSAGSTARKPGAVPRVPPGGRRASAGKPSAPADPNPPDRSVPHTSPQQKRPPIGGLSHHG